MPTCFEGVPVLKGRNAIAIFSCSFNQDAFALLLECEYECKLDENLQSLKFSSCKVVFVCHASKSRLVL